MRNNDDEAFELAALVLSSSEAGDDNFYVSIIIELDSPESVRVLEEGLKIMESYDEFAGHAQEKAIECLIQKNAVGSLNTVMGCLFDEADRVRATALQFVDRFDRNEALSYIIRMLDEEDVLFNILFILKLLVRWDAVQALPRLKNLSREEWVSEDEDLNVPFQKAIAALSRLP
jgi:HEAT repeat protein